MAALAGLALLAMAASPPAPVCAAESPACYTARARLRVGAREALVRVVSEDLPYPGDMTRWRYVLVEAEAKELLVGFEAGRLHSAEVCGAAVVRPDGSGCVWLEAKGSWRLEMRPTAPSVAAQFAARAGAEKCRALSWSVIREPGRLELLLEAPASFGLGR